MKPKKEILAVIPARGGSKSIPRKNLVPLAGRPLLSHSIQTALDTPEISRVVVSTDDPRIGAVALESGAQVVWRPAEISTDSSSSESALLDALEQLENQDGYHPDLVVFLQCTAPLTAVEDIRGTIRALEDERADSALAAAPFHYFIWRLDEKGQAQGINHNKDYRPLRQERAPQFIETGAVYVMQADGFKKSRHRFFGKTTIYIMPAERCFEIDEYADLQIAEMLLRKKMRSNRRSSIPSPVEALVLDFDGVFTDNRALVFQDGAEAVYCDRGDGWGLRRLKETGVPVLVLSSEPNPVVGARCAKLGLECRHGVEDKLETLLGWLREKEINPGKTVYLGNDMNDLGCLQAAGCGAVVADAHSGVRSAAKIILEHPGGRGAIRELVDLILEVNKGAGDA
ncbi:MAG: cytidylyltransferase domain-containing protein [Anaerolineales bacterium]